MRSIRDDPLADHHARGHVDEAQYHAGRAFQKDFEAAERGPKAIDFTKEAVDGGSLPEPLTKARWAAGRQLAIVYRELGSDGCALVHDILVHCRTLEQVAENRGLEGRKWRDYFFFRFCECLDRMATIYGLAMKKY